jgi:hypothetical protein
MFSDATNAQQQIGAAYVCWYRSRQRLRWFASAIRFDGLKSPTFLRYSDSSLCSFYRSTIRSPALLRDGIALYGEYNRGRNRFRSDNRHKTSAETGFVVRGLSIGAPKHRMFAFGDKADIGLWHPLLNKIRPAFARLGKFAESDRYKRFTLQARPL